MGRVSVFDPIRGWMRRTARKYMRPMSVDEAAEKREMFSILYLLSGATLFFYVSFMGFSNAENVVNIPEEEKLKRYALHSRDDKDITIIRFQNFTKVDETILTSEQINKYKQEAMKAL